MTLKDVERAGVSTSTVSHVINKRDMLIRISPKTRDKVLRIVDELGYLPNAAARNLVTRNTRNIGFIFANSFKGGLSNPFYSKILEGIELQVQEIGHNLLITTYESIAEYVPSLPRKIREQNVDGIIIAGHPDKNLIKAVKQREIPVLTVGDYSEDLEIDTVVPNNFYGVEKATEYLISLGHTRIAFIKLRRYFSSPSSEDKFEGYKAALGKGELKINPRIIEEGDGEVESGYQAMNRLLDLKVTFTAVIAANDIMALAAMKAIRDRGLRVPEDISIVGYDNIDMTNLAYPPLTTVETFQIEMGKKAVGRLFELANGSKEKSKRITTPAELVIRGSCARLSNGDGGL